MRVGAVILAAGSSSRFGRDKIRARLGGKPVWRWSYDVFRKHPRVSEVVLVCEDVKDFRLSAFDADQVVGGGKTRQESCHIGLSELLNSDIVLIHDAARPFVTPELIDKVIAATEEHRAAAPRVPVVDTIRTEEGELVDRTSLFAMQTPQGAMYEDLLGAHNESIIDATDDMGLIQEMGIEPFWVEGDPRNFKLTTEDDMSKAHGVVGFKETRTGIGYDVHRFSDDPNRPLKIGGVEFAGAGLEGHSDADALIHAVTDALLGASGQGDIGQMFPDDARINRNRNSLEFLEIVANVVAGDGWRIVNIDATVVAERPKIMAKADEIRGAISKAAGIRFDQVSVKATTNEGLGAVGRSEGLAAFAVATLVEN